MLRLLALALLLPTAAQAQALFECPGGEFEDIRRVMDPAPFEVWGELAGFQDGRMEVCRGETPDDAPGLLYALDDEGSLLLDATVMRGGEPLPFGVVVASTREERDGPIRIAAVGVADRDGQITMALPASRHAIRLTISGDGDAPPTMAALADEEMNHAAHENPTFVGPQDANQNVIAQRSAGPDDESFDPAVPYFTFSERTEDDTHRMAEANRAFAHFGRRRSKK